LLTACSSTTQPTFDNGDTTSSSPTATAGPIRGPQPAAATPLVADVIAAPVPVPATDGKVHLAYELRLTNVLPHSVTLTALTVLDRDVALLNLAGEQLAHWTRVLGNSATTTTIGPAQSAAIWLDVPLPKDVATPTRVTHAITVTNPSPQPPLFPATQTMDIAAVEVQNRKPVAISPPLTGANWVNGDGCCDTSAHRSALNPINGQLWAAERFAIDYVQLDGEKRLTTGEPDQLTSYPFYGADIHAVADGTVVGVVDGLAEQIPGTAPAGLPLDQYAGNHVVQDLGDGNFALYAHMKTGTVDVKPGDRVTSGQVLGSVGNTGNSTAPHLHFHVMSTPDPLRSDGLPFVFTDFRLTDRLADPGAVDTIIEGSPAPLQPGFVARTETDVMPLELDVMTYAER
jgi:hypothetical protein